MNGKVHINVNPKVVIEEALQNNAAHANNTNENNKVIKFNKETDNLKDVRKTLNTEEVENNKNYESHNNSEGTSHKTEKNVIS